MNDATLRHRHVRDAEGIDEDDVGQRGEREDGALHRFAKSYSSLARAEVDADRVKAQAFRPLAPEGMSMATFALRFALSEELLSRITPVPASAEAGPLEPERLGAIANRFRELYEMA